MVTRAIAIYVDMASFVINELKQVGIEATLKQVETAQWHAMATRGDYQIGANLTGLGVDDPDANFYENYALRLAAQLQPVLQRRSHEDDRPAVAGARSEEAPAAWSSRSRSGSRRTRPGPSSTAAPRLLHAHWPHVKGLVPHNNIYNFGRIARTCGGTSKRPGARRGLEP